MESQESKIINSAVYYRLISLWVLCEAMLGGIIHGFKIPVSGLVVGSCAVVCICLIAWYVPTKSAIIKATIIVAVFKMMLSPQAPPPAYIAVFFQGLLGELLFRNRRYFKLSCILLAVFGLLESGLQRILVLTIVYGNDLWKVFNNFMNGLTRQKQTTNYSLLIGGAYVFLHLVTGMIVGWWTALLPQRIEKWSKSGRYNIVIREPAGLKIPRKEKQRKRLKKGLFLIWILLIALYLQSYFSIGTPLLPAHLSLKILLRSVIIVLGWIFIVGPVLKQVLHRWLQKRQTKAQQDVQEVLRLLPATQQLLAQSWQLSSAYKGLQRINNWGKTVLVNALSPKILSSSTPPRPLIYILTAPVQTGKTSSLLAWSANKNDVYGILTPVINGKRVFINVHTKEEFPMEAADKETEVWTIGRFIFSKINFEKASRIIRESIHSKGWLVIDEIGPLELKGEGFCTVLKEVLQQRKEKIVLVIRDKEEMPAKLMNFFGISGAVIISNPGEMQPGGD